jgi:hypothetical protein
MPDARTLPDLPCSCKGGFVGVSLLETLRTDSLRFWSPSHSLRSVMPIVVAVILSLRSLIRARATLQLELSAGHAETAIASLRSAEPYDAYNYNVLHWRASAYLAAGRAVVAMNEYRKVLDRGRWLSESTRDYRVAYPLAQTGPDARGCGSRGPRKEPASLRAFFRAVEECGSRSPRPDRRETGVRPTEVLTP